MMPKAQNASMLSRFEKAVVQMRDLAEAEAEAEKENDEETDGKAKEA
jgi:hypothetical protein